jgi:hypothetical protein
MDNSSSIPSISRFEEGRKLWYRYTEINGYAFEPNTAGISALAQDTGLKPKHIKERINAFLQA